MTETHYIPSDLLEQASEALFRASGSPDDEARLIASRLVLANLAGHDSHGVIRIPRYMEMLREGTIQPGARVTLLKDNGATALVDGHWGYGQSAMEQTTAIAIERAREHGIAAVGVLHLLHIGRLADYAITASRAGQIALVFTAAAGFAQNVAPFGGLKGRLATNPFAAAFPAKDRAPVVFDMATSTVAEGKVQVARDAAAELPEGVLIDKAGDPTRDPNALYDGGAILPVGGRHGYKGYLMGFMVEVLAGILTGAGYCGQNDQPKFDNCTFIICIDVEGFRELDAFTGEIEELIDYLKSSPSRPGEEVLYPGEVELRKASDRARTGIPLAAETVRKLQAELDRHNLGIELVPRAAAAAPAR